MIYFLRHGQTDYNFKRLMQGQADIPLSQFGREQAENAAENLKASKFDVIYSSPLIRARETSEIINRYHGVPIVLDDRLKEKNVGDAEGKPYDLWSANDDYHRHPEKYHAESAQDFYDRCSAAFDDIKQNNADKDVLIVSHGGVYLNFYCKKHGISDFDIKLQYPKNCEVVMID